jgi:hypothetical protein
MSRDDSNPYAEFLAKLNKLPGGSFLVYLPFHKSRVFGTTSQFLFFHDVLDRAKRAKANNESEGGFFRCSDQELASWNPNWNLRKIRKMLRFFLRQGFMAFKEKAFKEKDGERWIKINMRTVRKTHKRKLAEMN